MFLKNIWYVACWDKDVQVGEVLGVQITGEPIAIYRKTNGELVALEDRCAHRFAPLSKGKVEGDDIRCMYHGLKFGSTGACLLVPGQEVAPSAVKVRTYPIAERYNWIWVWMGDPAKSDPTTIPNCTGLDDGTWALKPDHMDYNASYMLVCDNLLDFTHLSFVHPTSFGVTEDWALARPNVSKRERAVHVERWVIDQPPPSQQQELGRIDYFNTYDFVLPGILLMHEWIFPAGSASRFGGKAPLFDDTVISASFTMQAVTPMTEKTTRYLFAWGPRSIENVDGLSDAFYDVALMAFGEDKEMIEAQQKIVDADPGRRMMVIASDKALVFFRQMMNDLISAEKADRVPLS